MHIQVRAQVPSPGQGLLASCLLEPVSNKYGAWPASGEASAGGAQGWGGGGPCGPAAPGARCLGRDHHEMCRYWTLLMLRTLVVLRQRHFYPR